MWQSHLFLWELQKSIIWLWKQLETVTAARPEEFVLFWLPQRSTCIKTNCYWTVPWNLLILAMIQPTEVQKLGANLLRPRQLPLEVIPGNCMTQGLELVLKTMQSLGKILAQLWPGKLLSLPSNFQAQSGCWHVPRTIPTRLFICSYPFFRI